MLGIPLANGKKETEITLTNFGDRRRNRNFNISQIDYQRADTAAASEPFCSSAYNPLPTKHHAILNYRELHRVTPSS